MSRPDDNSHDAAGGADRERLAASPDGFVEDVPEEHDEDETELAKELGEIADEDNEALARAKARLERLVGDS